MLCFKEVEIMVQKIIKELLYEKEHKIRNGIYGLIQREMAYNSNRIEGSTLTKEDTLTLFNTGNIYTNNTNIIYRAKDIEEMTGHFAMFNKMLDNYNDILDENVIKGYHKLLKQGVFEDIANGYPIGEYKNRPNTVFNIKTSNPKDVQNDINELLNWYNAKEKNIETLARFHFRYEKIHPFQDGNGRTGRIILFKECLKNNIMPFIIRDINRIEYYNALKEAHNDNFKKLVLLFSNEQNILVEQITELGLLNV